jgi:GGDEF domain-containing protein
VNIAEVVIWSAMMGALLLLALVSAVDVVRLGNVAAWRGLGFVLLTGVSSVVMSGLPEYLLDITDERLLLPAKVAMGPLSGALTLSYLGIWFGQGFEDRLLRRLIVYGAFITFMAAVGMVAWVYVSPAVSPRIHLGVSAGINIFTALIAGMAAVRGTMLGDRQARWLSLASLFLTVLVIGLYSKGMRLDAGPWAWSLTAVCTAAYFLVVTMLTVVRNESLKQLARLARGNSLLDEITGLPIGSMLISKVDDALWRSFRMESESAVLALWVNNLYALNDDAGHYIEHEIRSRLTANLRQAVGFRNVVGLMQARCFVVVISTVQDRAQVEKRALRLLGSISKPMTVGELVDAPYDFSAEAGIGIVYVSATEHTEPMRAMDQAQKLAQQACDAGYKILQQELKTGKADSSQPDQ